MKRQETLRIFFGLKGLPISLEHDGVEQDKWKEGRGKGAFFPTAGNRPTTTWNFENQPTLYQLPSGGRVTMQYNGDNRRVKLDD